MFQPLRVYDYIAWMSGVSSQVQVVSSIKDDVRPETFLVLRRNGFDRQFSKIDAALCVV
jgi:hypothetical protein